VFEWPQRADAQAADITYKDRIEGRAGLTWEEKYLLQLGVLISLGRWETATQLIERGSAAGRLEYPALRRLLAEVTRALGVFGMNHFRDFLVEALGNQPEWDPDQDQLLQETTEPSATDEEKSAGVKKLAERSIHLFRCGLSLGLGYGAQAAQHMLQSKLEEQPCRQVISMLCYQFGFPLGMELAMRLDGGSGRLG
jgi:hypothetical protein